MRTQLVVGMGEVGTAIQRILQCDGYDPVRMSITTRTTYDVLHVCFPYRDGDTFERAVREYIDTYRPGLVIIHSTVPVGTCAKFGAVHSPVRGIHPHLEQGIRTFVKFFGGPQADAAAQIFQECGIVCRTTPRAENTEALKLWDTLQYGMAILLEKEIHDFCKENDLDFSVVYTEANRTYNEGYAALGRPEYAKYVLRHMDGPIGGHCVVQNARLLDTASADRLLFAQNGSML